VLASSDLAQLGIAKEDREKSARSLNEGYQRANRVPELKFLCEDHFIGRRCLAFPAYSLLSVTLSNPQLAPDALGIHGRMTVTRRR